MTLYRVVHDSRYIQVVCALLCFRYAQKECFFLLLDFFLFCLQLTIMNLNKPESLSLRISMQYRQD